MSLIFCYFRTKYKPRDFLWGPGPSATPTQKVETESVWSDTPPPRPARRLRGRVGSLLRRRGGRILTKCQPGLTHFSSQIQSLRTSLDEQSGELSEIRNLLEILR